MYISLKYKFVIAWTFILLLGICIIVMLTFKINKLTYGKKLILDDNIINITTYYTEYDVTVVSNKNVNTYFVKEWYKENIGSRIEYLDYMKNVVSVITTSSECYISNAANKAYILTKNIYGINNILSLATYINIFNSNITCNCSKNIYRKNEEINIVFNVCNKDNCILSEHIRHLGVTSFELMVIYNMPTIYTIYTGNKKEYASIVYNKFDTNILIEDSIFDIGK